MSAPLQDAQFDDFPEGVVDEFLEQLRAGEDPRIDDYANRFPHLKDVVTDYLQHIRLLESLGQHSDGFPTVEGYEIRCRIGTGSMGAVYAAVHRRLKRFVAIKILHEHQFVHFDRFCREAESVSRLRHPHIVTAYEFVERDQTACLIMPLIYGLSLDRLITTPEFSWPHSAHYDIPDSRVIAASNLNPASWWPDWAHDLPGRNFQRIALIAADVASALDHAHQNGIVHRDVKPGNLLLDRLGKVWILDFGLAHLTDASCTLSGSGDMIGTPRYMAPEQMRGVADARSDLYALGVTLWELSTGKKAWGERRTGAWNSSAAAMLLPRAEDVNTRVPEPLSDIIARCCCADPEARYQSAAAVERDLRELAATLHTTANTGGRRSALQSGLMFSLLSVAACSALQQLPQETRERPAAPVAQQQSDLPPEIAYRETFPGNGDGAASAAGWSVAHARNDAVFDGRLYGGFNAGETTTGTIALVTTTHHEKGQAGAAFSPIPIDDRPEVSFQYTDGEFHHADVSDIRLAIQVNGRWYASTKRARPNGKAGMSTFRMPLDSAAENWRQLQLGVGEATVGKPVTAPLQGIVTGIGIVQTNQVSNDNPIGAAVVSYDSVIIRRTN